MKSTLLMITATLLTCGQLVAGPFGDGFSKGDLSAYLEGPDKAKMSLVSVKDMKGKRCLQLKNSTTARFKMVSVNDRTKYVLSFRASFTGGESAEENPRLAILCASGKAPQIFPQREFEFYDAGKKRIWGRSWRPGIAFGKWQKYTDVFYPPARAAFMRVVIKSGRPGIILTLDNMQLRKAPDEGAINCNPVIGKYGGNNYSGWGGLALGAEIVRFKGKTVFDVQYGTWGFPFPLDQKGTYRLRTKGKACGYHACMLLDLLDANGKKIGQIGMGVNKGDKHFVLPPKVKYGKLLTYSILLEEVRLVRVGDENKIRELGK